MAIDEQHVHSDYSLLDGKQTLEQIVEYAKNNKIAVTLTEHGNMASTFRMYNLCKQNNVKCNIGCEFYFTPTLEEKGYTHLILIAKNQTGYQNLLKLQYYSFMKGFYYKPRIDLDMLNKCKEGLICLSACIGGIIPKMLLNNSEKEAIHWIDIFSNMFKEDFYLELQPHVLEEQEKTNKFLYEISVHKNIKLVVTSDAHYTNSDERDIHDTILCIGFNKKKDDPKRARYKTTNAFNTEEKIYSVLRSHGLPDDAIKQAINNTKEISNKCNVKLECDEVYLPSMSDDDFTTLAKLCNKKYLEKVKNNVFNVPLEEVKKRIKYELSVLKEKGFCGYFLIVYDFLNWCTKNGIPIGLGRGSVGGCEVAFLLDIHRLEPIEHGLLFERFLNPTRMGYPDIDSDIDYERRDEVVEYVRRKYGKENVSTVMAEGHLTTANVLRRVMSAYGFESTVINTMSTKYIPKDSPSLQYAYENSQQLKDFLDKNELVKRDCFALENNIGSWGMHAAGVIISSKPIYECVPVMRNEKNHEMMKTQWDKHQVEDQGLIKFDFLGLKLLTVYGKCLKNINKLRGTNYTLDDLYSINLNDENIYKLMNSGKLNGIFQFSEYSGMNTIKNAHPTCFEDVIACESICRPGVKEDKDYIANKQLHDNEGSFPIPTYYDKVKHILDSTYGAIIYQEQTLLLFHEIAGMTLGEADKLRKVKSLEPYREQFETGAIKLGFTQKEATELFNRFDLGYSFNKSHAGLYGMHSCITAYLKHYYFTEFMSAYMCMEMLKDPKKSKIEEFIMECKQHGIKFLAPDINKATNEFVPIDENTIMLPITYIKGLGDKTIQCIMQNRPYKNLDSLIDKTPRKNVNKTSIVKLIKAGAFDYTDCKNRNILLVNHYKEKELYWCDDVKMFYEMEVLGMTLDKHPLDGYINLNIHKFNNGEQCQINALITSITHKIDKKGNEMAFIKCENKVCSFECVIFSWQYKKFKDLLIENAKVSIQGKIDNGKILLNSIKLIR